MGLRLRKSFKIIPGLKFNLSKTGGSFSIGGPGATVNVGKDGVKSTVGLPGSGVSYSSYTSHQETKKGNYYGLLFAAAVLVLFCAIAYLRN